MCSKISIHLISKLVKMCLFMVYLMDLTKTRTYPEPRTFPERTSTTFCTKTRTYFFHSAHKKSTFWFQYRTLFLNFQNLNYVLVLVQNVLVSKMYVLIIVCTQNVVIHSYLITFWVSPYGAINSDLLKKILVKTKLQMSVIGITKYLEVYKNINEFL